MRWRSRGLSTRHGYDANADRAAGRRVGWWSTMDAMVSGVTYFKLNMSSRRGLIRCIA